MNLSDLQRKDIIDINTGKRLGKIYDARISENGTILFFTVLNHKFFHFWQKDTEINITMDKIKKIGIDTILVTNNIDNTWHNAFLLFDTYFFWCVTIYIEWRRKLI